MNMIVSPETATETAKASMPAADLVPPAALTREAPPAGRRKLLLVAGLVVAVGAAGWHFLAPDGAAPIASPAAAAIPRVAPDGTFRLSDSELRAIRVEPVASRVLRSERVAEGRISYNEDRATPVFPAFTGRVLRVHVQAGQQVEAGAPLFDVETTDLVQAANDLVTAVEGVTKARAASDLARRGEARTRELFAARAAARREMEEAQATLASAEADMRSAEATLSAARDRLRVLGRTPAQIAEIERARRVDAVVTVTAPIGGTVVQRRLGPGQWLTSGGSDPVVTIADLSSVWLVAAVRELDAPLMRVGQPLEVSVAALPGRTFQARIASLGASLDPTTRRLAVRAEVQDPDHLLKPEMFAAFRIGVGEDTASLTVPAGAVIYRGAEASVWEALDGNRFMLRQIQTGERHGDAIEVRSGLQAGGRVVAAGALFIDRAASQ